MSIMIKAGEAKPFILRPNQYKIKKIEVTLMIKLLYSTLIFLIDGFLPINHQ